jgi:hypothetical protein
MVVWKAARSPERFVSFRFDYLCSSHNIHHLACGANAVWHVRNLHAMQEGRTGAAQGRSVASSRFSSSRLSRLYRSRLCRLCCATAL